jgi:hypothetical protein
MMGFVRLLLLTDANAINHRQFQVPMNARAAPLGPGPPYVQSDVMISGVLLDLAGVIYEGERALPGALEAVNLRRGSLKRRLRAWIVRPSARLWSVTMLRHLRPGLGGAILVRTGKYTRGDAARVRQRNGS